MDKILEHKIQKQLSLHPISKAIDHYSKKHPALNLKIFCTDDPQLIKSFVMGMQFSVLSKIVSDHYSDNTPKEVVVEMIKIFDDHCKHVT